jgi:hypothetical protein
MATTTPNYGWPVPTSTDYVKDGATAIEALGDAIDATVFGLGSSGLTLINTTTLSASTGVQINSIFSSTYDQYFMTWTGTSGVNGNALWGRFSVGGTPNTSTLYFYGGLYYTNSAGPSRDFPTAQNKVLLASVGDISGSAFVNINNPFLAVPTNGNWVMNYWGSSANSAGQYGFSHNNAASYDGLYIFPDSGTLTGTLRFYGFKK